MLPWNRSIYYTKLGDWPEKAGNPSPHLNPRIPASTLRAKFLAAIVAAMVVAMVAAMGLLWLVPWDCHGCCYGCCYGIAMVGAMGWLWLLLWLLPWESGVILMTMAERSDGQNDGQNSICGKTSIYSKFLLYIVDFLYLCIQHGISLHISEISHIIP